MGRDPFLAALATASPRLGTAEINRHIKFALADTDMSITKMQIAPLDRDGNAVYFSSRMNVAAASSSRPVTGLSGFTLLKFLPLTI